MLEFGLVLLPLCLIVFGTIDAGRAFVFLDQLKNAAQAGAFFARQFPTSVSNTGSCADPNNIQYQVASELAAAPTSTLPAGYSLVVTDLTTSSAVSGCETSTVNPGDTLLVEVQAPFNLITPLIGAVMGHNLTLHGTSEVVVP